MKAALRIKLAVSAVLVLALVGCGPDESARRRAKRAAAAQAAADAVTKSGNASVAAETVATTTAPASYEVYPVEVRTEIYQWDLLNQQCTSRMRGQLRGTCEAAEQLSQKLLAKGWCYGGSDDPALAHWVLCAQDYPGGEGWAASPTRNSVTAQ